MVGNNCALLFTLLTMLYMAKAIKGACLVSEIEPVR